MSLLQLRNWLTPTFQKKLDAAFGLEFIPDAYFKSLSEISFEVPEDIRVPEIQALLNDLALSGGKRLRPLLTLLVGGLFRVDSTNLKPFARILELTHAATLIHDDVIDEAPTRRGRPTLSAARGNSRAVLAGDALIARVMLEMAATGHVDLLKELSRAVHHLVLGEWLQLESKFSVSTDTLRLQRIAEFKTSSLLEFAWLVGPIQAQASPATLSMCRELAQQLGVAFQMIDDVIDWHQENEKSYQQDLREGLVNFVTLDLIQSKSILTTDIQNFWSTQAPVLAIDENLLEASRQRIREQAEQTIETAQKRLEVICQSFSNHDEDAKRALQSLFQTIARRCK